MPFEWDPSLELGLEPVDSQHKQLVQLVNDLEEAGRSGAGMQPVFAALTAMKRYAVEHFRDEEALMEQHGYPALEEHRREHEKFVARTEDYETAAMADYAPFQDMLDFLRKWWLTHIRESDRAFINTLR